MARQTIAFGVGGFSPVFTNQGTTRQNIAGTLFLDESGATAFTLNGTTATYAFSFPSAVLLAPVMLNGTVAAYAFSFPAATLTYSGGLSLNGNAAAYTFSFGQASFTGPLNATVVSYVFSFGSATLSYSGASRRGGGGGGFGRMGGGFGRMGVRGGGGSSAPAFTVALAANRAQVSTAVGSIAANTTSIREHYSHPDGAITSLKFVDVGWYYDSNGTPVNADSRSIKRYVEYPQGTFTQITWSNATSVTVGAGALVSSDMVGVIIPVGTKFWERTVNLTSTVTNFPLIELPASSVTIGVDDGNDLTDKGNSGTITVSSGVTTFGAAAVMGTVGVANARSFVIVGDSLAFGFGDGGIGAKHSSGFLARALDVHGYPYAKITRSGMRATQFLASLAAPTAFINALGFTDMIQSLGINDLKTGSRSQAQLLADHQTIYGLFSGKRIYQTTLTPVSTSTDGWATTANQTPDPSGTLSQINSINAAIRAVPANVNVVIEVADACMSARDSDIWSAPPVAAPDGIHPNTAKQALVAAAISGSI